MAQEIERKFLVKGDFKPFVKKSMRIVQGYLSSVPERTVRVRIKGDKGFLTIKGIGSESGTSRYEWEKEIDTADVENLLKICEPGVIDVGHGTVIVTCTANSCPSGPKSTAPRKSKRPRSDGRLLSSL